MGFEILLTVLFILLLINLVILDCKLSKMKKDRLKLDVVTAITALEMAVRKLNEKLRYNTQLLSDYKQRLKRLEERVDILENGHPDSDIDYGEVDDRDEVVCVWFEGKKYVPEDKRGKDTITLYADNKVVAETTIPEEKPCCATCQHYRPESGYSTCDLRTRLHATKKYATMADSACNNYEKTSTPCVSSDKGKVEHICGIYEEIGGNGETERLTKKIADLNYFYNMGLMSAATYMHRWEELMHNDS